MHCQLKDLVNQKTDKERAGWIAEENLRKAKNDLFNAEQEVAELKREEGKRSEELTYNNEEIERQQVKLNKLNDDIETLQLEEKQIQSQLKSQNNEIDKLKNERLLIQEQTRQICNDNSALSDCCNEEKQIIEKFEREIEQ